MKLYPESELPPRAPVCASSPSRPSARPPAPALQNLILSKRRKISRSPSPAGSRKDWFHFSALPARAESNVTIQLSGQSFGQDTDELVAWFRLARLGWRRAARPRGRHSRGTRGRARAPAEGVRGGSPRRARKSRFHKEKAGFIKGKQVSKGKADFERKSRFRKEKQISKGKENF